MTKKTRSCKTELFCSALLASLFWGGLAQLDPLGVKTAAALHSETIFMRLIGGPWYQSEAQDKITVVLIDDNYIEQVGEHWPMSYIQQELLISDILAYKPQAIFLDLLYRHKHGADADVQQLVGTIRQSQVNDTTSTTVPIFIPYMVKDIEGLNTCNSDKHNQQYNAESIVLKNSVIKEMQLSGAKEAYIGWTGCGNRYPSFILGDAQYKTPSFALYQSSCKKLGDLSKNCANTEKQNFNAFADPMVVRWGLGVSEEHQSALSKAGITCLTIDEDNKLKYFWSQLLRMLGQSFSSTVERGKAERCTYTDTVHATWFLGMSPEIRAYMKEMIEDRIVLVGTQIEGVHDYVISPVNGKVPGVYLLAMALDNYYEYGSDYFKEMNGWLAAIVEIILLFGITFFVGVLWYWSCDRSGYVAIEKDIRLTGVEKIKGSVVVLIYKFIIPVILSLIFAMVMWHFRFAPMDWIGVSLLSFIVNPVKIDNCFQGGRELDCVKKNRVFDSNYCCRKVVFKVRSFYKKFR